MPRSMPVDPAKCGNGQMREGSILTAVMPAAYVTVLTLVGVLIPPNPFLLPLPLVQTAVRAACNDASL